MKTNKQNDAKILRSARFRIRGSMVLVFCAMVLYFVVLSWILSTPWLKAGRNITNWLVISLAAQIVLMLAAFLSMNTENPHARIAWYVYTGAQCLFSVWLVYQGFTVESNKIVWLIWAFCSAFKIWGLYHYGRWLATAYWPKIFFDKTLLVYEPDQPAPQTAPQQSDYQQPARPQPAKAQRVIPNEPDEVYREVKVYSYPQMALRIAICVYLELFLFPILCEILHPWLISTDRKYGFATTVMFTLCIISAIIWTVAVFFLYLRQPKSKMVILICGAAEILCAIWTFFILKGYGSNQVITYKWHVFALFTILDLARLGILAWVVWPIFRIPVPVPEDYSLYDNYEDELDPEDVDPTDVQGIQANQTDLTSIPEADPSDSASQLHTFDSDNLY